MRLVEVLGGHQLFPFYVNFDNVFDNRCGQS